MDDLYTRFDQVFFERTRLSIVTLIEQRASVSFNALKAILSVSDGALWSHLDKLIESGYVTRRKELAGDSVQTVYTLTPKGAESYREYLGFLQAILQGRNDGDGGTGRGSQGVSARDNGRARGARRDVRDRHR
ncbi:MAG: winged helix-turn-helix transcriptional regulator [Spirochaetaceae bacterium]|nr:MAG: winged helix-turn-helix transcriptional regulator [Spirochaetaceae bacterium]